MEEPVPPSPDMPAADEKELKASNEELRSTTEALETSREALRSINEELITVNHPLKLKVEEAGQCAIALRREPAKPADTRAASELKDEFLAMISHELKNPLNLIHLNAELLARLPETKSLPSVVRAAETIRKTVMSQARIIDDLLDLLRMNTGKLSLNRAPVDWGQTVASIVQAAGGDAAEKSLTLEQRLAGGPMIVDADAARLEQIVHNLLGNAFKSTPAGGRVTVSLRREAGFGVLEVRDSGRGIDSQQLPKMFGMFEQQKGQRSRNELGPGIGPGIGLAIVQQLVALHGGRFEGASQGLGRGAVFTVWLPLHGHRAAQPHGPPPGSEAMLRGLRVFVLDDDAANTETLHELLSLEGAEVTAALKPAEALGQLAASACDVLISDIDMPEMDGYALIAALRAEPATRDLPVVALTGFSHAADTSKALDAGFDAHLGKPVTLERLTATLLSVVRRRKGSG